MATLREALINQHPSLALQRAATDEIARLDSEVERLQIQVLDMENVLRICYACIADTHNGYPERELYESPARTLERIKALIPAL